MNEHHETSSNPYEDEQQIPYASWEENKTSEQEKEAATPSTPQLPPSAAPGSPGVAPQAQQWYGRYPYASPMVPQHMAPPKQDSYLQGLAITTIICSALLLIVGLVGVPVTLLDFFSSYFSIDQTNAAVFFSYQALYLTGTIFCLAGGGFSLFHAIRSVLKRPSTTVVLPPFWALLIPYVIVLAGLFAIEATGGEIPLVLLVILFLVAVSPLAGAAFIALSLHALPSNAAAITWRRLTVSLVSGATAPFFLVALLYSIINTGLRYALYSCAGANPPSYCTNGDQFLAITFILIAIIGPIIIATITPLLLAFYIRKVQKAGEALLLGLACGTGFGIMEGVFIAGTAYHNWVGVLLTSFGMIIINGTGAALVTLGWYHVLNPDHRHLPKAFGYWLWAVVAQIIFYLLSIAVPVIKPIHTFLNAWKVSLGTGIVSLYEIGYMAVVIVVAGLFLYLMQRLRKEDTLSAVVAPPSPEVVAPSSPETVVPPSEVSSDVSELSSDV
jgi:hypothetical protein